MNERDELAARAPITWQQAALVSGEIFEPGFSDDCGRALVMQAHARLCYEWADAMIAVRSEDVCNP